MVRRQRTVGTGITERTVYGYEYPITWKDRKEMEENTLLFSKHMEEMGLFKTATYHARAQCESILNGKNMDATFPDDSPEDFAKRILRLLECTDQFIKNANSCLAEEFADRGDSEVAARLAFDAGVLWERALMKWYWEREALIGQKILDTADAGAEQRRGRRRPGTARVIAEMERLIAAGQSQSNAARVAAEHGIGRSAAANRQAWARHTKKVVTHP